MKNLSTNEAIRLLRLGTELMVKPYDGDDENFTGITIDDYEGQEDEEIAESLKDYTDIQNWNEPKHIPGTGKPLKVVAPDCAIQTDLTPYVFKQKKGAERWGKEWKD